MSRLSQWIAVEEFLLLVNKNSTKWCAYSPNKIHKGKFCASTAIHFLYSSNISLYRCEKCKINKGKGSQILEKASLELYGRELCPPAYIVPTFDIAPPSYDNEDKKEILPSINNIYSSRWITINEYMHKVKENISFSYCAYSPIIGIFKNTFCGQVIPPCSNNMIYQHRCTICFNLKGNEMEILFSYLSNKYTQEVISPCFPEESKGDKKRNHKIRLNERLTNKVKKGVISFIQNTSLDLLLGEGFLLYNVSGYNTTLIFIIDKPPYISATYYIYGIFNKVLTSLDIITHDMLIHIESIPKLYPTCSLFSRTPLNIKEIITAKIDSTQVKS